MPRGLFYPERAATLEVTLAQNILDSVGTVDQTLYQPQNRLRRAITDFCVICQGGSPHSPQFNNANKEVRECSARHCPLYLVRAFQSVRSRVDNEPEEPNETEDEPSE